MTLKAGRFVLTRFCIDFTLLGKNLRTKAFPKYCDNKKQQVAPEAVSRQTNGNPYGTPNRAPANRFCKEKRKLINHAKHY
jgi:hypothetical protein